MRIKFSKGEQRKFLKDVLSGTGCPSLRKLNQFGFNINYSTLKDYYQERRLIPEEFFKQLCELAKINEKRLRFQYLDEHWGQVKGGRADKKN